MLSNTLRGGVLAAFLLTASVATGAEQLQWRQRQQAAQLATVGSVQHLQGARLPVIAMQAGAGGHVECRWRRQQGADVTVQRRSGRTV